MSNHSNKNTAKKSSRAIGAAVVAVPLLMGLGMPMAHAETVTAGDNTVTNALENTGNHLLKAFVEGDLKPETSLAELKTVVPDAFVVPSNIKMAIVYIPESPSQFALCGWGHNGEIGQSKASAYVYKSTSGNFSPMGINCEASGAGATDLDLTNGDLIESGDRPEGIPFPAGVVSLPEVSTPVPEDVTPPAPEKAAEPVELPIAGMVIAAAILVGIGILIALIALVYKMSRKFKHDAQNSSVNQGHWKELVNRCDAIMKEWASYELDPVRMIDYPLLSNMNEPRTVQFHASLRKAKHLRPSDVKKVTAIDALTSPFATAVSELENAFHTAETEAKRVQWSNYTPEERKRLQTAKSLLNLAMNGSATDAERQSAYKRMQKELDGLIVIPKTTILALEKKVHLMLTDGSEEAISLSK